MTLGSNPNNATEQPHGYLLFELKGKIPMQTLDFAQICFPYQVHTVFILRKS